MFTDKAKREKKGGDTCKEGIHRMPCHNRSRANGAKRNERK
jgi:hypothetical protein